MKKARKKVLEEKEQLKNIKRIQYWEINKQQYQIRRLTDKLKDAKQKLVHIRRDGVDEIQYHKTVIVQAAEEVQKVLASLELEERRNNAQENVEYKQNIAKVELAA